MTKTEMRLQAGVSTNILAKMGKGEPVAMESLAKIATALNCGLDDMAVLPECHKLGKSYIPDLPQKVDVWTGMGYLLQ